MQQTQKIMCVLFTVLLCGGAQISAQESETTQQEEAIRKLETRIDELKAQMAEIQSQLEAIRGTKLPRTGSIVSTPPPSPPQLQLTPEQQEEAIGEATSRHQTFNQDEEDASRLYNAPLEPEEPGFFHLPGTRTMMRLDGSVRSDFIYDPRISTLSDAFIPSSIPIPSVGGPGNFLVSVRASRAMADFLIP